MLYAIRDAARIGGWKITHFRPARTAHGWRTSLLGDKGWPDCLLVRPPRIIAAELKSKTGRLTPDQEDWLDALGSSGVDARVIRPADLDAFLAELLTKDPMP